MHTKLNFLVFCVEEYKNAYGISGHEVVKLFDKYEVFTYLQDCYEALHTMGTRAILDDIDEYMGDKTTFDPTTKQKEE